MTDNSAEYNQRSMRAIILCVMVAIVYTQFFLAPQKKEQQRAAQNPSAVVEQPAGSAQQLGSATGLAVGSTAGQQPGGAVTVLQQPHPTAAEIAELPTSVVDTGLARVVITHLGARVANYQLTRYRQDRASDAGLDLIRSGVGAATPFGVYVGQETDERVRYTLVSINGAPPSLAATAVQKLEAGSKVVLEFKGTLASGIGITKRISLTGDSYLFAVDVQLDRATERNYPVWLEWTQQLSSDEQKNQRAAFSMTFLGADDKISRKTTDAIEPGVKDFGVSKWVAFGDTYFTSVLASLEGMKNAIAGRYGDVFYNRVAGTPTGGSFAAYLGPKEYKTLESIPGMQLERTVDLGWFSFLSLPLLWLLRFLHQIFGNYGVAIIGLTLLVKAVLLPLSKASFESGKKMQQLAPEMKALRERIKDPNQLNQEMMALYKRKGVNPMGGCLPVAIQIPVFVGLYNALLSALELRHSPYALWITDLSAQESLKIFGIGVPVMVLLMAASMVYQTWTTPNPSADPTQQKMMMIMPLVFAGMFIVFPMPAGLVLYLLVNNTISIVQQLYMRSSDKGSVYLGTAVASAAIFGIGYLLTLI